MFDRIFSADILPKRERVERTLNLQAVDRVALHAPVSFNPGVIALYTGRRIEGFAYTVADICEVIRQTLDACFPPVAPRGTKRVTDSEGFVVQHDNLKVLYHSDGNWKRVIPDLVECGVDGFYCLEPAVGMDNVRLRPNHLPAEDLRGCRVRFAVRRNAAMLR